ncbi:uncharacterized protein LOC109821438 [Asparagus officinalis]|uniref:uncharacterized protein LOC109821438 n=1 Tax=Asparagus officinalis TaxID=4686 RepID=UPI00098E1281|nr:uncharacterized protein LOC109821438 [Asparagus officinalis]
MWDSNVRPAGKARIIILWDPNIFDIHIINMSDQQISCSIKSKDGKLDSVISAIYGFNQLEARKSLWDELTSISQNIGNIPWLLCGDFNAIISPEEKLGGVAPTKTDTGDFRNCIEVCALSHLKTQGCFFTWTNKQEADARVWSRLDRALINDAWVNKFTSSHVEFMMPGISDHSPGIISVYEDTFQGKKPFRFYKMWINHDSYIPTVSKIWHQFILGYPMFSVYTKLKLLRGALKDLNKKHFYNISEQVLGAKIALEEVQGNLQVNPLNCDLIRKEKECYSLYNKLLDCELSFYKQKARIAWSLQGDRNTRFFHSLAKSNMHNNRIVVLYNSRGDKLTDGDAIVEELVTFYRNLLGTASSTLPADMDIIKAGPCLSDSQIIMLSNPVTNEEIKTAIFSMSEDKSPGSY